MGSRATNVAGSSNITIYPNGTNTTDYGQSLPMLIGPHGPLCRLQHWLWRSWGRTGDVLGNRVSSLRYWLWRLCR